MPKKRKPTIDAKTAKLLARVGYTKAKALPRVSRTKHADFIGVHDGANPPRSR